jgi:hypothetical protein
MVQKSKEFDLKLREKLLLWCDRHCCLCKKQCDVFIELHHIIPKSKSESSNDEDNAIPLCFECHAKVGHYNDTQPKGNKFKPEELKKRRDQVYEQFTRHLVPALDYKIIQTGRTLPDVGFAILHLGDAPPVQVLVTLDGYLNGVATNFFEPNETRYAGKMRLNLNPKVGFSGHFSIPQNALSPNTDVRIGIYITMYDCYDRPHELLPLTYVYDRGSNSWWLDPVNPQESAKEISP